MSEKLKIVFAHGCFDEFDGTQEDLNELITEITRMTETGEILEKCNQINLDDLTKEERDLYNKFEQRLADSMNDVDRRRLN